MDNNEIKVQLKNYIDGDGKLKQMPKKRALQVPALFYLASKFEAEKQYAEREINEIITRWHTFGDTPMLRRFLYQTGFLDRREDGSVYWLKDPQPKPEDFESWINGTF